jgi:hypothetical protein
MQPVSSGLTRRVTKEAQLPSAPPLLKEALARPQLLTLMRQSHRTLRPPPTGFNQSLPGMLVMIVMQMILTC